MRKLLSSAEPLPACRLADPASSSRRRLGVLEMRRGLQGMAFPSRGQPCRLTAPASPLRGQKLSSPTTHGLNRDSLFKAHTEPAAMRNAQFLNRIIGSLHILLLF